MQHLDLSFNGIDDSYGQIFKKLIITQTDWRTQTLWSNGLREYKPSKNLTTTGLFVLILAGNKISDGFATILTSALKLDDFIPVIDLHSNSISEKGVNSLIDIINNENKRIISLDLRDNPGLTEKLCSKLAKKLVKVINKHKKDEEYYNKLIENKWINKDLIKLITPEKNLTKKSKSFIKSKKTMTRTNSKPQVFTEINSAKKKLNICNYCQIFEEGLRKVEEKCENVKVENNKMKTLLQNFQTPKVNANSTSSPKDLVNFFIVIFY